MPRSRAACARRGRKMQGISLSRAQTLYAPEESSRPRPQRLCPRCGVNRIAEGRLTCFSCLAPAEAPLLGRPLTGRESEVLSLLVDGHTNKEIGGRLGLTEGTVKMYVFRIGRKLGKTNRKEIIVSSLQWKIAALEAKLAKCVCQAKPEEVLCV